MQDPNTPGSLTSGWRKPVRSISMGACVEVASGPATVAVRDTKNNGRGPVLTYSPEAWTAFVEKEKAK